MIIKTRGIIFKVTRFRETSIITHVFTEELGLRSYLVNNVRSSKSKIKMGYFEPLSLLELSVYNNPNREINRIKELKASIPLHSVRQDISKTTMVMFLAEVLNKCIIEQDENRPLFNFIFNALSTLESEGQNNDFHLQFLLKLTQHLGFGIHNEEDFIKDTGNASFYNEAGNKNGLLALLKYDFSSGTILNKTQRSAILIDILHYYEVQIGLSKLKSLAVLNSVFA